MRALLVAGLAGALLLGAGCDKKARSGAGGGGGPVSPTASPSPSPVAPSVIAELASATLADDCGQHAAAPATTDTTVASAEVAPGPRPAGSATMTKPSANRVAGDMAAGAARGKCAGPNCNFHRPRACQQTTMQLTLTAPDKLPPTSVEVVKIELLDEGTKASLGELTAREPNVWRSGGQYQPWDGTINARDGLNVSYKLSAPDWNKLAGSRAAAAGKSFLMRVTLRIGGQESAVDRVVQSAPLMVEPHVVT